MKEIIAFFKDIFMMKEPTNYRIGLCQFKTVSPVEQVQKEVFKSTKDIKLSDLMRRSV